MLDTKRVVRFGVGGVCHFGSRSSSNWVDSYLTMLG